MGNTALPRIGDGPTQDLINRLEIALNDLEAHPLAGLVLVTQPVTTADGRVYHGLGQPAQGYFVVRSSAPVIVVDGTVPETTDPRNYVSLRASGSAMVTLAVF